MGIKPPDIVQPFPTLHMIQRAKLLNIEEQGEGEWLVWEEGHSKHIVKKEAQFYTCDCQSYIIRQVCSHITAVRIDKAEGDREDLFSS